MSEEYPEVKPEDFTKITTEKLPHQKIEMALMVICGSGRAGADLKYKLLKAAGWKKLRLSTFAGDPVMAADVFNKIRLALLQTEDADKLMALLIKGGSPL